jgi:hypothetical protein
VLPASSASAGQRGAACPAAEARRILARICSEARWDEPHEVIELYALACGEAAFRARGTATTRLVPPILQAAQEGRLLVVPGFPWSPAHPAAPAKADAEPANREDRVVRAAMKGRAELGADGEGYRLVPAAAWRGTKEREGWEVLPQDQAAAALQRLQRSASGADARALTDAAGMLADTRAVLPQAGLFVLRRIHVRSFSAPRAAEPALSPSQLFKKKPDDWIEVLVLDDEGNPLQTPLEVVLSDGRTETVTPDGSGVIRFSAIPTGSCKLTIAKLKPARAA